MSNVDGLSIPLETVNPCAVTLPRRPHGARALDAIRSRRRKSVV